MIAPSSRYPILLGLLLLAAVALFAPTTEAATIATPVQCPTPSPINPAVIKGKRFFDSVTGAYIPLKGIAYYPRPNAGSLSTDSNSVDFFSDTYRDLWTRDIANLQNLGINLIRIYAVDPSQNHDAFMCALSAAGIYVMIGLLADCEGCAIGPDAAPSCYPASLKHRGHFIIDAFSKYSNVLAFSAGNEVTLYARDRAIELNAPCQKKFISDMRQYVSTCRSTTNTILPRSIPIGMVNWDNQRERQTLYFNCQTDPTGDGMELPEWYGLNSYQHCDPQATTVADLTGWDQLRQDFTSYDLAIPTMITEYGCRHRNFPALDGFEAQRNWLQVDALYSPDYTDVFAGGVVFEYSAEKIVVDESEQGNPWPYQGFMKLQYGVGYYAPVDCDHTTTSCVYNSYPEFDGLKSKLAAVDASTFAVPSMNDYVVEGLGSIPQCPSDMPLVTDYDWPTDLDGTSEVDNCLVITTPSSPPSTTTTVVAPEATATTGAPFSLTITTPAPTTEPGTPSASPTTAAPSFLTIPVGVAPTPAIPPIFLPSTEVPTGAPIIAPASSSSSSASTSATALGVAAVLTSAVGVLLLFS